MAKLKGYQDPSKIDRIVIHCTATPNGRVTTCEDVDAWHKEKSFKRNSKLVGYHQPHLKHIGYHYVVYTDGSLAAGRSHHEMGAHAYPHNRNSLGVSLVGLDQFSQLQWESLRFLIRTLLAQHPGAAIVGHYDLNSAKTCPGFNVKQWLHSQMRPHTQHVFDEGFHVPGESFEEDDDRPF